MWGVVQKGGVSSESLGDGCPRAGGGPGSRANCSEVLPWPAWLTSRCPLGGSDEPLAVLTPALPCQAQLIHDRNTAAHAAAATRPQAPSTPDKVQMTWTKEKLLAEKHRNKEASAPGFRDLFSLKP